MRFGPAQVVEVAATTTDVDAYVGACLLHGWGWRETTDTARAEVELRDGTSGPVIVPVNLKAGQTARDWLSGGGIYARQGLTIHVRSGSVAVSLWIVPLEDPSHAAVWDAAHAFQDLADTIWETRPRV